tara:strand:+ start:9505 stop:9744 length:240 start_codon:yes stop_codon:yes gene_type:complete
MGLRIIYKSGEQKACSLTEAQNLVANEGWSWTDSAPAPKAVKKTAKPKKAKVEVEAVELKPVEGEDLKIIDFGNIDEEK